MQTHSPLKQYRCNRCEKSFALKSYLNKHYESSCFRDGTPGSGLGGNECDSDDDAMGGCHSDEEEDDLEQRDREIDNGEEEDTLTSMPASPASTICYSGGGGGGGTEAATGNGQQGTSVCPVSRELPSHHPHNRHSPLSPPISPPEDLVGAATVESQVRVNNSHSIKLQS